MLGRGHFGKVIQKCTLCERGLRDCGSEDWPLPQSPNRNVAVHICCNTDVQNKPSPTTQAADNFLTVKIPEDLWLQSLKKTILRIIS